MLYQTSMLLAVSFRTYFDFRRKIGYCSIPKIACSTWKSVMANNTLQGEKMEFEEILRDGYIHRNMEQFTDISSR